MKHTLEYWVAMYEKHTGEKFAFKENYTFFYKPEHGFCEYKPTKDCIYIWALCGDLSYWHGLAVQACKKFNIPKLAAWIVRHPKPFIRRLGFKIYHTENRNGDIKYWCIDKQDKELICTPYGDRYIFEQEVSIDEF